MAILDIVAIAPSDGNPEVTPKKFPLGQAGLMGFDYIPLGPLSPLRIINDMVK